MKTEELTWREELRKQLPEDACDRVVGYAKTIAAIRPPMVIYARESVPERPFDNWDEAGLEDPQKRKSRWGARCMCTECGEWFDGGYREEKIELLQMEDGEFLPGWTDGNQPETIRIGDGDVFFCPMCGEKVTARRRSRIGKGRSYTTQVVELTNIGKTTVLLYWLATYFLEKHGYIWYGVEPRAAVAISPSGRLHRFTHKKFIMEAEFDRRRWESVGQMRDPELMAFNEGGSMFRSTIGGYYIDTTEDMQGTTGEKTGIKAYFSFPDAIRATTYLQMWKKYPNVENLANTGAGYLLTSILRIAVENVGTGYGCVMNFRMPQLRINFKEKKPHRMLQVTKPEYRLIVKNEWEEEDAELFLWYRNLHPKTTAAEFQTWLTRLGRESIHTLREYLEEGLDRLYRYLCRRETDHGIGAIDRYYRDYRQMLDSVRANAGITGELTQEQKFPGNLVEAHERVNNEIIAIEREKNRRGTKEQIRTFAEMKEKHAALEWRKGEFCIIIPGSPEELVREGETLHHCVGGYAAQHCSGKMIFFVRHARRPERSWYTLNEDINRKSGNRIQLHGYRNELVHGKKLTIPKEVTEFVQEWEKTVLAPYLDKQNRRTA